MQNKGCSPAAEVESDLANPGAGGRAARRGRADGLSPQDESAAPRFSPAGAGRGEGSGAAGALVCARAVVGYNRGRASLSDIQCWT